MTTIAGQYYKFNNVLYSTQRLAEADRAEHKAGRVPLDLSYKGDAPVYRVLNAGAAQINGKRFDIKYQPKILRSRPCYGYDARYDPTILNAVRYNYTDVSGLLISPINLPKKKIKSTYIPFKPIGIVR
jgi:hypothetical protein